MASMGVRPMPAEASGSGPSPSGSRRSPKGRETWRVSPALAWACSREDTSPSGTWPSAEYSRLTVMRQVLRPGAEARLYCRIWCAPSGSSTRTLTYWPGRTARSATRRRGAGRGHRVRGLVVSVRRPPSSARRHRHSTWACAYSLASMAMRSVGHQPVDLVPGGGHRRGHRVAEDLGDRAEEVAGDQRVLVGGDAEGGVLVRDAASTASGRSSGCSTSAVAKAATAPASASFCAPLAWFARLNKSRSSSGPFLEHAAVEQLGDGARLAPRRGGWCGRSVRTVRTACRLQTGN